MKSWQTIPVGQLHVSGWLVLLGLLANQSGSERRMAENTVSHVGQDFGQLFHQHSNALRLRAISMRNTVLVAQLLSLN
jgi:hypothetical protein